MTNVIVVPSADTDDWEYHLFFTPVGDTTPQDAVAHLEKVIREIKAGEEAFDDPHNALIERLDPNIVAECFVTNTREEW